MSNDYCPYDGCNHAVAIDRTNDDGQRLCEYHATGQDILDGLYAVKSAILLSGHYRLTATLDSLDVEENTVRELYQMLEEE